MSLNFSAMVCVADNDGGTNNNQDFDHKRPWGV